MAAVCCLCFADSYKAGQYCDICIPSVSSMEWHPFTIASSPRGRFLEFYIKVSMFVCVWSYTPQFGRPKSSVCVCSPPHLNDDIVLWLPPSDEPRVAHPVLHRRTVTGPTRFVNWQPSKVTSIPRAPRVELGRHLASEMKPAKSLLPLASKLGWRHVPPPLLSLLVLRSAWAVTFLSRLGSHVQCVAWQNAPSLLPAPGYDHQGPWAARGTSGTLQPVRRHCVDLLRHRGHTLCISVQGRCARCRVE